MDENNNDLFNGEEEKVSSQEVTENETPDTSSESFCEKVEEAVLETEEEKETDETTEADENDFEITIEPMTDDSSFESTKNTQTPPPFSYTPKQSFNGYNQNGYYTGTPDTAKKKKKKSGIKVVLSIVAIILVIAISFGIGSVVGSKKAAISGEGLTGDGTIITNEETPDSPTVTGDRLSVEQIAEIGRASNVGVLVYTNNGFQGSETAAGEGTGIVAKVSKDGKSTYILTCAHVISDKGASVKILLEDGTTYNADIVGYDQQTDVGVLKVNTTKLTCATFGDFKKLKVGSAVYAVGNPGGSEFFGSVTNGIVSAISRSINNEIGYTMDCIQHNAAINPGNSGGALLNEFGQVIGINSSKIASTEYEGMSFSVPISTALEVANELIAKGYVPNRPKLGITYSLASSHNTYAMIVQIKGLPAGSLIIRGISSDSDLKSSDVQIGDMIIAVNGQDLDTPDVLLDIIDKASVGDELKLKICRVNTDYSTEEFEVTAKLIEDKGSSAEPEEESTTYINPFDYFSQYGY